MTEHHNSAAKWVDCPACQTKVKWSSTNPNRPFCSERCKNIDFVGWANEEQKMPGNSIYDDVLSNDLDSGY